jgi:putative glycerol-1-phosphate prenyltransferase
MIYHGLEKAKAERRKKFAVLIDPDKIKTEHIDQVIELAKVSNVDYFFLGGSLILDDEMNFCIEMIKRHTNIPVVLFPGSTMQVNHKADTLLFLSLISGRNPDLLIGRHVETAPLLLNSPLEVLPTGYMLIDGGMQTSVQYMSNTRPIPANKKEIALCTALAGQLLGMKLIFMDAGSGAKFPISEGVIKAVSSKLSIPLIVGGGIRTPERAVASAKAGADVIVVGNAIEDDPTLLMEISSAVHSLKLASTER